MVICLERGADLHIAQLMPLQLTDSCFSKIQIGFTFLVPAHPGSPGKMAVKQVCVCVVNSLCGTLMHVHIIELYLLFEAVAALVLCFSLHAAFCAIANSNCIAVIEVCILVCVHVIQSCMVCVAALFRSALLVSSTRDRNFAHVFCTRKYAPFVSLLHFAREKL